MIRLEVGKHYRTKDNMHVFIYYTQANCRYEFIGRFSGTSLPDAAWREDGRFSSGVSPRDIIEEWTETPISNLQEGQPMKIEPGKFYKTRSGKMAYVITVRTEPPKTDVERLYPILGEVDNKRELWTIGGQSYNTILDGMDLVGEWDTLEHKLPALPNASTTQDYFQVGQSVFHMGYGVGEVLSKGITGVYVGFEPSNGRQLTEYLTFLLDGRESPIYFYRSLYSLAEARAMGFVFDIPQMAKWRLVIQSNSSPSDFYVTDGYYSSAEDFIKQCPEGGSPLSTIEASKRMFNKE